MLTKMLWCVCGMSLDPRVRGERSALAALLAEFLQELGPLLDDDSAAGRIAQNLPLAAEGVTVGIEGAGRVLPFHPKALLLQERLFCGGHGLALETGEGLLPGGIEARFLALDLGIAAVRPFHIGLGAVDALLPVRRLRRGAHRAEQ